MKVIVSTLTGLSYHFDVKKKDTIIDLKQQINKSQGIPIFL